MLLNVATVTVAVTAVCVGLVWYKQDELILGEWWEYSPIWLQNAAVSLYFHMGIYSRINATRILYDQVAMKPDKDDLNHVDIKDIYVKHVPVRVFRPKRLLNDKKAPAVIFLTGGGFIYGSIKAYQGFCYRLARIAEVVVFAPEYRRAPEYIFPTAVNDCYEATIHIVNDAAIYEIDAAKVVLAGVSAGGNLAAAISQQIASIKQNCLQYSFAAQVLIYPTLQFFDFSLPSYQKQRVSLSKESVAKFWSFYITGSNYYTEMFVAGNHSIHLRNTRYQEYLQEVKINDVSYTSLVDVPENVRKALTEPRACPVLADDLRENPPTLIITADNDVFRDEGIIYSARLKSAGVKVKHMNYPLDHGFFFADFNNSSPVPEAKQAFQDLICYIKGATKQDNTCY